jgi:hypothetical protein
MNNTMTKDTITDASLSDTADGALEDDAFSYEGYQVVHGEFFSHTFEPAFTLNNYKVSVNTACIRKVPDTDFIQILVNPEERKLTVKPCLEHTKDSFRWCSNTSKRSPKQIICPIFFAKIIALMGWNPDYRYRLLGKLLKSGNDLLFVFDLTSPEIYTKVRTSGESRKTSHIPVYPSDWKNQFGLPAEKHLNTVQVHLFNGYTVFGIQKSTEPLTAAFSDNSLTVTETEQKKNSQDE